MRHGRRNKPLLTVDDDYTVNMVGYNYVFSQLDIIIEIRDALTLQSVTVTASDNLKSLFRADSRSAPSMGYFVTGLMMQ